MLCHPFDERRLARWEPPYIVQPKFDGERARAVVNVERVAVLLSSEGNVITSVPHINRALEQSGLRDVELDGELYTHGMRFEEVHSRVGRTVNEHTDSRAIEYHVFDLVDEEPQGARVSELAITTLRPPLHHVPFRLCSTLDEIMRALERYQEKGYEGIVVRHAFAPYERKRSLHVMKFKPHASDVYEVVGVVEERALDGTPKGRLGALVCWAHEGEHLFNVGTGFTADDRVALWARRDELPGQWVEVKYQNLTPGKGVPRFPVWSRIVRVEEM